MTDRTMIIENCSGNSRLDKNCTESEWDYKYNYEIYRFQFRKSLLQRTTISRHSNTLMNCECMKTEFHNLINLKVALANIKSYSLNYGIMVNVFLMWIDQISVVRSARSNGCWCYESNESAIVQVDEIKVLQCNAIVWILKTWYINRNN